MAKRPARGAERYFLDLRPRDPLIRLAHGIFSKEFEQLLGELPASGDPPQPGQVHELRIATRRLRVALRLFAGFVGERGAAFRREFRWLGRALGELRDLDVYAECIAADLRSLEADSGARPTALERGIERARTGARRKLNRTLETKRFRKLIESFARYVGEEPSPKLVRRWRSLTIADAAYGDLMKTTRRVVKLGRKIDERTSAEALHRLRIKIKRLRYELEFYMGFYPPLVKLAKKAKRLQDFLGLHQDACVAAERLERYAAALEPADPERGAVEALSSIEAEKAARLCRNFASEWHRFEKSVAAAKLPKRRKGRA